ncbi:ATP-binding protein [Microcoleus sp. Pol12B4]|uniref:ATP-binding protein n=1 Tax=Microcoleus sp. Pol12B4 TaxID=3055395 RepID=UPI002FD5E2AA
MFDPTKPKDILKLQDSDLSWFLPDAEDDRHEYKSSVIEKNEKSPNKSLGHKIVKAASGFWNSGGGLFVVGVDDNSKPDGGISLSVGNLSRRDWIDTIISQVTPRSSYVIHSIQNSSNCVNIEPDKAVFLIGFCESEIGPHMANDNRYYIRAGAHTEPANHFFVEAIHARRGLRTPLLSHIVRRKPGNSGIIQLGIVALNAAAAINVSVESDTLPNLLTSHMEEGVSIQVPIISEQFPLFFDVCELVLDDYIHPLFSIKLTYFDIANRTYQQSFQVDIDRQLGPNLSLEKGNGSIEEQLKDIAREVKGLQTAIKAIKK